MDSLSAREAIPMDEETARDIQGYLVGLVKRWSVGNGPYPLNEKNLEKLHAKLLHVAIKACERHDPRKAPLVPYVKAMSARSAKQLAARIYWAQCKLGESRDGDLSLDGRAFTPEDEGDSFLDFIAEDEETAFRRTLRRDVNEALRNLPMRERIALKTLMFQNFTDEKAAMKLHISRPTFVKFRDKVAVPHFRKIWMK